MLMLRGVASRVMSDVRQRREYFNDNSRIEGAQMVTTQAWRRLQRVDFSDMDYPGTLYRAAARNFKVPNPTRQIRYVVIHITGGRAQTEGPAINTFKEGPASAHYIVNRQGHVTQFVRDAHIANHIGNINSVENRDSIGIEHVNQWNQDAHLTPTDAQYEASARLVAWLCRTYLIPIVHNTMPRAPGIRGHKEEAPNAGHVDCPNPAWDWNRYIAMVQRVRVETFEDVIHSLTRRGNVMVR